MDKFGRVRQDAGGENYRLDHLTMVPPVMRTVDPKYQAVIRAFMPREWNTMAPEEQARFWEVYQNNQNIEKRKASSPNMARMGRNPFFSAMSQGANHANSNAAFLKGLFGGGGDAPPPLTATPTKQIVPVPDWAVPNPPTQKPVLLPETNNFRSMLRRLIQGD